MEEAEEAGEAAPFDVAQAKPNLYDNVPGAAPRSPPPPATTPGGTQIRKPDEGFIAPKQSKPGPELDKSLKDAETDMKGAKANSERHPTSTEDLSSWYSVLSPKQKEMADKYQDELKKRGLSGWFDPKISGDMLKFRGYLFDQTSGHWRNSMERKERKKTPPGAAPDSPEKFFGTGKKSELKDDAPAIANMGGSYMEQEQAPEEA